MSKAMHREPSIHCSRSNLIKLLKQVGAERYILGKQWEELVDQLMFNASKYSLSNRKILATNKRDTEKTTRLISSTLEDARLYSRSLLLIRRQLHHRGITQIKESSKEWITLKEVTQLALEFVLEFNLEKLEGFNLYNKIACSKMKSFSLMKIHSMNQAIFMEYEAMLEIEKDPEPHRTETAHNIFNNILLTKTGQGIDYKQFPEKYRYFINIAQAANSKGITIKQYIEAQFAAFDWKSAVPEVTQMVGPKADERVVKFMFEKGISKKKDAAPTIDFSKLRNPDHDTDNFE